MRYSGGIPSAAPPVVARVLERDAVVVHAARYEPDTRILRVHATSTDPHARLTVLETATGSFIGLLGRDGGGPHGAPFTWPSAPERITVRSTHGGVATRSVSVG